MNMGGSLSLEDSSRPLMNPPQIMLSKMSRLQASWDQARNVAMQRSNLFSNLSISQGPGARAVRTTLWSEVDVVDQRVHVCLQSVVAGLHHENIAEREVVADVLSVEVQLAVLH